MPGPPPIPYRLLTYSLVPPPGERPMASASGYQPTGIYVERDTTAVGRPSQLTGTCWGIGRPERDRTSTAFSPARATNSWPAGDQTTANGCAPSGACR